LSEPEIIAAVVMMTGSSSPDQGISSREDCAEMMAPALMMDYPRKSS
jgi:hypothetical protein